MKLRTFAITMVLFFAAAALAYSQAWVPLVNQPDALLGLGNPLLLLTDGTVLLHQACGPAWYKLSPDQFGSYVNGTWKRIASLPAGYWSSPANVQFLNCFRNADLERPRTLTSASPPESVAIRKKAAGIIHRGELLM